MFRRKINPTLSSTVPETEAAARYDAIRRHEERVASQTNPVADERVASQTNPVAEELCYNAATDTLHGRGHPWDYLPVVPLELLEDEGMVRVVEPASAIELIVPLCHTPCCNSCAHGGPCEGCGDDDADDEPEDNVETPPVC